MIKSIFLSISALLFFQISLAQTQLKLPALVSDNMVLQQSTEISIWGWAEVNNTVKILPSWTQVPVSVKVNNSGKWKASLNTPVAGGPYTIALSSSNESIVLKNVMIGEVWLASGQSNMEMPIKGYWSEPINGNNELILNSKNSILGCLLLRGIRARILKRIVMEVGKFPVLKTPWTLVQWATCLPKNSIGH